MKVSYYVSKEFLEPVVQDFFEDEIVPKMVELEVENASVCVAIGAHDLPFVDCVVYEYSRNVDGADEFSGPTDKIARSKAEISWRTGLTTRDVMRYPEYLREGDAIYPGSTIREGLIVAISGFPPDQWDEALSIKLAGEIWGRVMDMFLEERKQLLHKGVHFLPKRFTYTSD